MDRRGIRAMTLAELLVSLGVMLILLPAFGLVIDNYYQIYGNNFTRVQCGTQLSTARESIYRNLSQVSAIRVPEDGMIAFRMPVCGANGYPIMPFDRQGVLLALYRSDATGATGVAPEQARYLWLGRGNIGATTVTPHGAPLARNVTGLTFEYLDAAGSPISRATRFGGTFDDKTVSLIRVTVTIGEATSRGHGRQTTLGATDSVTFVVAPRNNHD